MRMIMIPVYWAIGVCMILGMAAMAILATMRAKLGRSGPNEPSSPGGASEADCEARARMAGGYDELRP